MNICIQKPAQLEDLITVNRGLYKDMDRLIKFGSAVFDTVNNRVSLSLIEDIA